MGHEPIGIKMDYIFIIPIRVFPKIGIPQNGWFIMEKPIRVDDLGVPLFLETSINLQKEMAVCWDFFFLKHPK